MACGIYKILNKITNKIYVGYSRNLMKRQYYHLYLLKRNKHHNEYLQNSFNKYGINNFSFEILEECHKEVLVEKEDYWCKLLNAHNFEYGYNIEPTGSSTNKSERTITKLLESNKRKRIPIVVTYNNVLREFESISQFCKEFNFRNSSINRCLKKGNSYLHLYDIRYKDKANNNRVDNRLKTYYVRDENNNLNIFSKRKEMLSFINISPRTFTRRAIKIKNNLYNINGFNITITNASKERGEENN